MIERVARIRVELKYTQPKVWRRVEVPLSFTLWDMNDVIQAIFDWDGDHLWGFELGRRDLTKLGMMRHWGWGPEEAEDVQIKTLVDWGVKKFSYTYDYGDSWEHLLTIMRVLDANPRIKYPNLVAGANFAPMEDMGGIWGYYKFVEAAGDPNHPDRKDLEEQYGESCMNDFDPERFDKERADSRLAYLR
jgi:hypothetical protein